MGTDYKMFVRILHAGMAKILDKGGIFDPLTVYQ